MTDKQLEPCSMGVGCDEVGICYANAHGKPENCPKQRSEDVDLASRLFAFAGITPDCPHNPGFSHLNYFARELVLEAAKDLREAADRIEAQAAEIERLKVQLSVESEPSPYCPICGSCGDEGCCGSKRCLYPAALQEQSK
jgi:hypothetical protein